MAVIIKGIDILEPSAGTNSLQWAWQNGGPASGEVLIFGENGLLTNGTAVASETTSEPTFEPTEEFYINQLTMNAADNLSNYPGFTNAMYFNGSDDYLSKAANPNASPDAYTISFWFKPSSTIRAEQKIYCYGSPGNESSFRWADNAETIEFSCYAGSYTAQYRPKGVIADTSSYYHFVGAIDRENSLMMVYVNGVAPERDTGNAIDPNSGTNLFTTSDSYIGRMGGQSHSNIHGYMANIQFIDGQALDPSYFGQYLMDVDGNPTSAWAPKLFDGTSSTGEADVTNDYGTNGFLLDFSKLGLDSSGDIDKVYDTAPISGSHSAANDWTAH